VSRWSLTKRGFKIKREQTHLRSCRWVSSNIKCSITRVPGVVLVLQVPLGIVRVLDEKVPSRSLVVGRLEEIRNVGIRGIAALVSPSFDQQRRVSGLGQVGGERTTARPAADDDVVIGGRVHHRYRRQGGKREQKHGELGWRLSRKKGWRGSSRERSTRGQEGHLYKTARGPMFLEREEKSEPIGLPYIARIATGPACWQLCQGCRLIARLMACVPVQDGTSESGVWKHRS
jgi:hypothetical protein